MTQFCAVAATWKTQRDVTRPAAHNARHQTIHHSTPCHRFVVLAQGQAGGLSVKGQRTGDSRIT
eukprot:473339-Rhodomonas_salina.1